MQYYRSSIIYYILTSIRYTPTSPMVLSIRDIVILLPAARWQRSVVTLSCNKECIPAYTEKSIKLPDPLELTDSKVPLFEDWLLFITQKLKANADHYNTPLLWIAFVSGCTSGKVQRHIIPCL